MRAQLKLLRTPRTLARNDVDGQLVHRSRVVLRRKGEVLHPLFVARETLPPAHGVAAVGAGQIEGGREPHRGTGEIVARPEGEAYGAQVGGEGAVLVEANTAVVAGVGPHFDGLELGRRWGGRPCQLWMCWLQWHIWRGYCILLGTRCSHLQTRLGLPFGSSILISPN